jgi:P4 family phage/plasmid primase-like protien
METVRDILDNTRVNGDYHTHVSMIQPLGKFQLGKHVMNNFWDKYSTSIINEPHIHYGIAEKPQSYIPVIADIDIKVKFTDDMDVEKLYTKYQLESIVRDYQDAIKSVLKDCTPQNLYCFVLEKPPYVVTSGDSQTLKNGLHLAFPYTFLSKIEHEVHLLPRVKKLVKKSQVFSSLGYDDSSVIIDNCYTKNPWLLYGSKKAENMEAYKLTHVLDEERDIIPLDKALNGYKMFDENENLIVLNFQNPGDYTFHLPQVLSIVVWHREVAEIKPDLPNLVQIVPKKRDVGEYKVLNLSESLERCRKLLAIISDDRASCYSDWMSIGWALYNISDGSNEGLGLWVDFSSRCEEKFDEDSCMSSWEKMEKRNMTIGTLAHFAKLDNPIAFGKYTDANTEKFIEEGIMCTSHYDIAKACYEKYGTEFTCASIVGNIWYQYEKHHWRKVEEGVFLRQKLSEDFADKIALRGKEIHAKIMDSSNDGERGMYAVKQKLIQKLVTKLKDSSFKGSVMKEAKEVFYNERFMTNLNKNQWLIGMRNGVYDLKNNIFRAGVPEDFISLQMPIDYSEYDEGHSLVKEVYDFFEKIFPDKELRDYFMDISCDVFVGGNQKKHVYFWSGEGNNGKSVMQLFFEKMLGEYSVKLPTSLVVGKRTQSSGAAPEIVRCAGGPRWAVLQEPDRKDVINLGMLKELSGNDTMYARGLFKEGADLELMIKLCVICNDPPIIPHNDKAAWNRIKIIPFESIFCNDAPDSYEEQIRQKRFPMDPYFSEKIPKLVKPFMWVLLNHRKKGQMKYVEPNKVLCATDAYKKKNDIYKQFEDECISVDPKGKLTLAELWICFKDWYKDSIPGKEAPIKNEVKEHYSKVWGEPSKGGVWRGRKTTTIEDEIEAGTVLLLGENDLEIPQDSTCSSNS